MVRLYLLNGSMMTSREEMHSHLYMQFALPEYYGRNLDALWDCLTEKEPGIIVLQQAESMDRGEFHRLVGLFLDLIDQNPHWALQLSTGCPDCESEFPSEQDEETVCTGDCAHCKISNPDDCTVCSDETDVDID